MINNEFNILVRLARKDKEGDVISPKWLYPIAIEKVYAKNISGVIKDFIKDVNKGLEDKIELWVKLNRRDSKQDDLKREIDEFRERMEALILSYFGMGLVYGSRVDRIVEETADKVMEFALGQWKKQTAAVLGDPYNSLPSDWIEIKRFWMEENHNYIRKLAKEYNDKLDSILVAGLLASWGYDDFIETIQKLSNKMFGYRSGFLAMDQIGNLNSQIIENYAKSIDNDEFVWNTMRDERVRGNPLGKYPDYVPSHFVMDTKVFKYSDTSVYSVDGKTWNKKTPIMEPLLPGRAPGCRCTASMYWNNFIKKVGGSR